MLGIDNPFVSIVVLTYNQEKTISQTLDSILSQKTKYSYEIVVGEDASQDGTRAICEQYAAKYPGVINLLPTASNKGLLINLRDVYAQCRGRYIACCAGDDYWCDDYKLQKQVDFLEANLDYGVTHTDMLYIDDKTEQIITPPIRMNVPDGKLSLELYQKAVVMAPTVCYRRELLQYVDLDKWADMGFVMEDLPMWLAFAPHTQFKFMPEYMVAYRINQRNSATSRVDKTKVLKFALSRHKVLSYFNEKNNIGISQDTLTLYYHKELFLAFGKNINRLGFLIREMGFLRVLRFYFIKIFCPSKY